MGLHPRATAASRGPLSVVTEAQRDALDGLSVEEKQILMSALERVLANLRLRAGAGE